VSKPPAKESGRDPGFLFIVELPKDIFILREEAYITCVIVFHPIALILFMANGKAA
jgi:hypothetical protein